MTKEFYQEYHSNPQVFRSLREKIRREVVQNLQFQCRKEQHELTMKKERYRKQGMQMREEVLTPACDDLERFIGKAAAHQQNSRTAHVR